MAHPEADRPSQQNLLSFYVFLFHYFLVPLDTISEEAAPESLHLGAFIFVQGTRHSENVRLNHNTELNSWLLRNQMYSVEYDSTEIATRGERILIF